MPDALLKTVSATEAPALVGAARVRQLLRYNRKTGLFHWRVSFRGGPFAGDLAGCLDCSNGYWVIGIDGRTYGAHRLAWLYVHGFWARLDHRNRTRADNRLTNLREATQTQNNQNKSRNGSSRSQLKGASWDDGMVRKKKWRARINVNGKRIELGRFETAKEANRAYARAAQKHFGEFAHA